MDVFKKIVQFQGAILDMVQFSLNDVKGKVTGTANLAALKTSLVAQLEKRLQT